METRVHWTLAEPVYSTCLFAYAQCLSFGSPELEIVSSTLHVLVKTYCSGENIREKSEHLPLLPLW